MNEFIRDRIVCGIHSDVVRRLLLREPDLTLEKAKELCVMHEMADLDSEGINIDPEVHSVKEKKKIKKSRNSRQQKMVRNCKYCLESHPVRECPAYGKQCSKCQKYNHFPSVCLSSVSDNTSQRSSTPHRRQRSKSSRRSLHEIGYEEDEEPEEMLENFVIEAADSDCLQSEIHVTSYVSGKPLKLKMTPAQNVMLFLPLLCNLHKFHTTSTTRKM